LKAFPFGDQFMQFRKKQLALAIVLAMSVGLASCDKFGGSDNSLAKATKALQSKDLKSAELFLKTAIQKQDSAEARVLLGGIYRDTADFKAAESEYRRAIELGADRNKLVPLLFDAMFNMGEFQKVIDDSKNLAVDLPESKAMVNTALGRSYLSLAKTDLAKKAFQDALEAKEGHLPAKAGLASLLAISGDKEGARRAAEVILAIDANSPDAAMLKADLLLLDGKLIEARDLFSKIITENPSSILARAKITAIEIDLKNFDSARAQWKELAKLNGASPGTTYLRALLEFRDNKLEPAREAIQFALKVSPDYVPTLTLAANIYLALNSFEQAEKHARMVLERAPGAIQAQRLLAATYLKMNSPERALQIVQPLVDKNVEDPSILALAGEAALKLNDPVKAAIYFEKASKLDPNDPSKRTGLALAKMASGDQAVAFNELEQAVEIDSKNYQADIALIMGRVKEKQYDKALEAVTRLEKKLEKSPLPYNLRGMVLLAKGDNPASRTAFQKALDLDPTFFAAAANLASLDMRENKSEDAKKRYETLLVKDPKNTQALIALASLNSRLGGSKETSLEYLRRAKSASPGAITAVLALANFYMENRQPRDAIPIIQEGLTSNPNRLELLDVLGSAYLQLNDRQQAMDTFDRMVKVNPTSAALQYRMGELRASMRDDNGAFQNFKRASDLQPKAVEPKIAMASMLLRQGKVADAKAVAAQLQKEIGNSPAGLTLEGDLLGVESKWAEASQLYKKAFGIEKSVAVGVKLHQAYFRANKISDADAFITEWFVAAPNDITMRLYAGEHEIARQRWPEAVKHYDVVLKTDPKHTAALNNVAWALNKMKDPRALSLAEQAYALAPQSPAVIDTLGYLLVESGNTSRGLELLRQAVSLAPKATEYRLHLAEALSKAGDKGAAKKELDLVLKDAPTDANGEAAKALAAKL
jgi:cellulose synthase operon protein C